MVTGPLPSVYADRMGLSLNFSAWSVKDGDLALGLSARMTKRKELYKAYIKSEAWRKKRKQALAHHGHTCGDCGKESFHGLDIHHLSYKHLGAELMDELMPLCRPCHVKRHEQKERKRKTGTTPRKKRKNPRALGTNPRALKKNPRSQNPKKERGLIAANEKLHKIQVRNRDEKQRRADLDARRNIFW